MEKEVSGAGIQIIHSQYVELMRRRAIGELPDMGCALELSKLIRSFVEKGVLPNNLRLTDVGCATGHYYRAIQGSAVNISRYVGLEINEQMVSSAREVWSREIESGLMTFVHDNIESGNALEKCDLLFCYNSFMYYQSAEYVLRKFLDSAQHILIRSYFADDSYRIIRGQSRQNNDAVAVNELEIFDDDGGLISGDFWTIYGFGYIESLVKKINPAAKVTWLKDGGVEESIAKESALGVVKRGGTEVIGGYEISYPLLQPWEILHISVE